MDNEPSVQEMWHSLVSWNFQALINKHTFSKLPPAYQYKLIQLLPECDYRLGVDGTIRFVIFMARILFAQKSQQGKLGMKNANSYLPLENQFPFNISYFQGSEGIKNLRHDSSSRCEYCIKTHPQMVCQIEFLIWHLKPRALRNYCSLSSNFVIFYQIPYDHLYHKQGLTDDESNDRQAVGFD